MKEIQTTVISTYNNQSLGRKILASTSKDSEEEKEEAEIDNNAQTSDQRSIKTNAEQIQANSTALSS